MVECFDFEIASSESLECIRAMHIKELKGPVQEFIEEGIVVYNSDFISIMKDGTSIGYACIGTYEHFKDMLLEYYIMNEYSDYSGQIFKQLVKQYGCKEWIVNTKDFFSLPVMLDLRLSFEIDAYQFTVAPMKDVNYKFGQGVTFQLTTKDELPEVYRLVTQDAFYTGGGIESVEGRLSDEELYSLRSDGRLVGVGFVSILKRTPSFADIAMIIEPDMRHKGLGTGIVKALIQQCRHRKLIPTAVCSADNKVSRSALQRAGFHLDGCTLLARI